MSETSGDRLAPKRLYKSSTDRRIDGVCSGVAEYLGIDPTVVRVAWVFSAFFVGVGILAYLVAAMIMPRRPEEAARRVPGRREEKRLLIVGLSILALGSLLLFENLDLLPPEGFWKSFFSSTSNLVFPIFFILLGLALVLAYKRGEEGVGLPFRDRRLSRVESEKLIGGVCAGVARYFQVDASVVRLLWVVGTLFSKGLGILLYLVLLFVIPLEPAEEGAREGGVGEEGLPRP